MLEPGEKTVFRIEPVQAVICADPQLTVSVLINRKDGVRGQGVQVVVFVVIPGEVIGRRVVQIQAKIGPYPESATAVTKYAVDEIITQTATVAFGICVQNGGLGEQIDFEHPSTCACPEQAGVVESEGSDFFQCSVIAVGSDTQ